MHYKITREEEAVPYDAPGHYGMLATRLHQAGELEQGRMILGLSHFLPDGGCETGSNPLESIYYIVEGQMELETADGCKTTLRQGDSFHCAPGVRKGIRNNGTASCRMLVCLLPPEERN